MIFTTFLGRHQGHDDLIDTTAADSWVRATASFAFLVPAVLALGCRQWQLALALLATAIVPYAQFLSSNLESTAILSGVWFVCSHLCVVQVATFLITHWNPHLKLPSNAMPTLCLALCALVLTGVWTYNPGGEANFYRFASIWDELLICANIVAFYLCSGVDSQKFAADVFRHTRFWRQFVWLPLCLAALLIVESMEMMTPWPPVYFSAGLRGAAALLATVAITSVLPEQSTPLELGSPAVHWLLSGCAATLIPMMLLTLAGDFWEHASWRWPTLSMAGTSQIGGFVLTAFALPFALAIAIAIRIVDSVPPPEGSSAPGSKVSCHKAGCQFARLGVMFFIMSSVWAEKSKVDQIFHTGFATAMFVSFFACISLTALGSYGKARMFMAGLIIVGMGNLMWLFAVVNNYVWPQWAMPHYLVVAYACTEYSLLALVAAYPMTWIPEAILWQQRGFTDSLPQPLTKRS